MSHRWTESENKAFAETYREKSISDLSLFFGRSQRAIMRHATHLGMRRDVARSLAMSAGLRQYKVNESYFDVLDTAEKVYWFGFLYADASIDYSRGVPAALVVEIDRKDEAHLALFKQDIESEHPLRYRKNRHTVTLYISSKKMVEDLLRHNLRPKYQGTNIVLDAIPRRFYADFIRGYFDGDGSVTHSGPTFVAELLGERSLCERISDIMSEVQKGHIYHKKNLTFDLRYCGYAARRICSWLYIGASRFLRRKRDKWIAWEVGGFSSLKIQGAALPRTIDPAAPANTDSPEQGDDQLRLIKNYLIDIFGAPNNSAVTAAPFSFTAAGVLTVLQSPLTLPTLIQGGASPQILRINSQYSQIGFEVNNASIMAITVTGMSLQTPFVETVSGVTMVMGTKGSQSLVMRTNTLDRWAVDASGMLVPIASNVDIGTTGGPRPRNTYLGGYLSTTLTTRNLIADQNDYDIDQIGALRVVPTGATRTITGFSGGSAGRELLVVNGASNVALALSGQNASSLAANRIILPGDGTTLQLIQSTAPGVACLMYDSVTQRWRVISTNIV